MLPPIGAAPVGRFGPHAVLAGFSRAATEFTLASAHVLWGKNAAERLPEVVESGAYYGVFR